MHIVGATSLVDLGATNLLIRFVAALTHFVDSVSRFVVVDQQSVTINILGQLYFVKSAKMLIRAFARINKVCHRIYKELKPADIAGQRLQFIKICLASYYSDYSQLFQKATTTCKNAVHL